LIRKQPESAAAYRAVGRNRVAHAAATSRRYGVARVSTWGIVSRKGNVLNITDRVRRVAAVQGLRGSAPKYAKGNDCADNAAAKGCESDAFTAHGGRQRRPRRRHATNPEPRRALMTCSRVGPVASRG